MDPQRLSDILWREREALDDLVFRLEVEQQFLRRGDTRWISRAAAEVEAAVGSLDHVEDDRLTEASTLARILRLDPQATLRQIGDALGAPWDHIFADHHRALLAGVAEADSMRAGNDHLLDEGHRQAQQALSLAEQAARRSEH
jgi:hypothetical protein